MGGKAIHSKSDEMQSFIHLIVQDPFNANAALPIPEIEEMSDAACFSQSLRDKVERTASQTARCRILCRLVYQPEIVIRLLDTPAIRGEIPNLVEVHMGLVRIDYEADA